MMCLASLLVSLLAHAAILSVIVIVPLIFFYVPQVDSMVTFLLDPPFPPVQPPPPVPVTKADAKPWHVVSQWRMDLAPPKIPFSIAPPDELPEPFGIEGVIPEGGDIAQPAANGSRIIEDLVNKEPLKLPRPEPPQRRALIPVGGQIQESKLVFKVNPVYPEIARRTHVSGSVVLEAVIDEEGNVSTLKVLSGHPFLAEAAVQAVKQWKYSPTVLNGEPVPVLAMVTVVFRFQ
jgi:protein TonB